MAKMVWMDNIEIEHVRILSLQSPKAEKGQHRGEHC